MAIELRFHIVEYHDDKFLFCFSHIMVLNLLENNWVSLAFKYLKYTLEDICQPFLGFILS